MNQTLHKSIKNVKREYVVNAELLIHATKRIQDSSIISSIRLKFDNKSQCLRTDLNKRSLPRPKSTTA